jgi:hypothetical protein
MDKNSFVKIIDVTNELLAAKSSQEVYYPHDIHWNLQGGFIGYKKLIAEIQKTNPDVKPVSDAQYMKVLKHTHNADLSRILSLENILLNDEWALEKTLKSKVKIIDPPSYGTVAIIQPTIRSQIENSKLPKAVVFRDSYFGLMQPFFSENFRDCIYLWTKDLSAEVVEKEKPDIVVFEMLETNIDKLLEDNPTGIRKQ